MAKKINKGVNIVVLDGFTLNPGDLSWEPLAALGELKVYDRTPYEKVPDRARNAQLVITNKALLTGNIIESLPELTYIGVTATGCNVVNIEAARRRSITVTNVPEYGTTSVAQMVFAHILNLCLHVGEHSQSVSHGAWAKSPDFCYWDFPLIELAGLTLGIIGYGRIGRAVAQLGSAFGMHVLVNDITTPSDLNGDVKAVDLNTLFRQSDVISLHCPLTPQTENLVSRQRLKLMKPTAFFINTSRGPLVEEQALAEVLDGGLIAGAGLDVLEQEPPADNNPLFAARNCYITPHIAWATASARERLMLIAVENVKAFLSGSPQNVVS
ncbi:MAG: D-2-hydroxyacid dehydrogenase [Sedimentisphaerales bacterium]|nr:D-2-hydroxyacid dehydrogenase [Sedimentisphaerales bacterium]